MARRAWMRAIGQADQRIDGFQGKDGTVLSGNGKSCGGVVVRKSTMLRHGVADRPFSSLPVIAPALLAFGLAGASPLSLIIIFLGLISVSLIGIVAMTRGPGQTI